MDHKSSFSLTAKSLGLSALLLGLALFSSGCGPGLRTFPPSLKNTLFQPRFGFFIVNYPSPLSDSSVADFYSRLRYDDLVFEKNDSGFAAHYQFSVSVFSDKDLTELQYSKIFDRHIIVRSYAETNSTTQFDTLRDMLALPAGKYYLVLKLLDFNTSQTSSREFTHVFKNFREDPIGISDVLIYDSADTSGIPVTYVKSREDTLSAEFYVTTKHLPSDIALRILAKSVEVPTQIDTTFHLAMSAKVVHYRVPIEIASLEPGSYVLKVSVEKDKDQSSSETYFSITRSQLPKLPIELDQDIDPLIYIASPNIVDQMKKGTFAERKEKFLQFWLTRAHGDSALAVAMRDEFYKRVDYANNRMRGGIEKGWRSDQGRVYIIYGPPDQVDNHEQGFNSPAYQIWYYYSLHLEFVFVDEFGTGDYRLVQESQTG